MATTTPAPADDHPLDWGTSTVLNGLEALMWRAEADPRLRSTIVGVEVLDRAPEWTRFREAHEWGTRLVPRFRMRITDPAFGLGQPVWVADDAFDLDVHVRRVRLPDGATVADLLAEAARIARTPFDKTRSPWEATLVEGLPDGRAGYVLKLHHSATDGIGTIQLLEGVHSRTRARRKRKAQPPAPELRSAPTWRALVDQTERDVHGVLRGAGGLAGLMRHPTRALDTAASLRRVLADPGATPSPLLRGRSLRSAFLAYDVAFADLRAAGKATDGTLNDAFLAALLGGLRRYHEALGHPIARLPMAIPVSLRADGDAAGGNRFAAAKLAGPVAIADAEERVRAVGRLVRGARAEPALDAVGAVAPLLARLPGPVVAALAGPMTRGNDLQASNVPGIREDVYLAGAKVERLYPFPPLPGCAIMAALVTHGDTCCLGLHVDPAAVTDVERFAQSTEAGFAEVLALAGGEVTRVT